MKLLKHKGGWPSRKRHPVVVRPSPDVIAGLDRLARRAGRSRSSLIETWLAVLVKSMKLADRVEVDGDVSPDGAVEIVSHSLLAELNSLDVLSEFLADGVQWLEDERRRVVLKVHPRGKSKVRGK